MKTKQANKSASVAEQGAHVAPEGATPKKGTTRSKKAPTTRGNAKGAKPKKDGQAKEATASLEGSKKAKVLALLERKDGATLAQMMKATGWQKHSVRGFLSGALGKKVGLAITNAKSENGDRAYRLGK